MKEGQTKETKEFFTKHNRLNKGYSGQQRNFERDFLSYRKRFEHILPPLDVISQYEEMYPGTLEKLISITEQEQKHKHEIDLQNSKIHSVSARNAQISSVLIYLIIALATIILSMVGQDHAALWF